MSPNLREKVHQAVEALLNDLSVDSFVLCVTRDFWDSYDENDFLDAYKEADKYYRESIIYVTEILGCNGAVIKRSENNFPSWLPVDEACFWYLDARTFVLYWEHEDKELPVVVWLYAFNPMLRSHRLFNYEIEE
ncbi:MAG TPA: hypothetical protein IGS53_01365 [Leptolyngbyaceae cyanobacterium M33_DOE_097]|uniref:Uncharacterized protein n=1 Tax=Oscillatoriales cyanobacterium SpSt-418 TaxID=2282169 RepID=A0A7C3PCZ4_9CYAN|nr:hypothetical protein [Leptolyngbyaceae cyanobacterium M33_DOE_097]